MRRVLVPLVLVALVAAACGESTSASLQGGDATTTSTPAAETAAGVTTTAPEAATTSTTTDDGNPSTESTETVASTTTTTDNGRTPATVPQTTIPPTTGEGPSSLVDQIIADAAERAGIADSEVTVIRSEAVVWNDSSLGCPQPGVAYTQALVDGYWIVVEAAGTEYDYRATSRGSFMLCEMPTPGGSGTDR